jgi:hypothetical protein
MSDDGVASSASNVRPKPVCRVSQMPVGVSPVRLPGQDVVMVAAVSTKVEQYRAVVGAPTPTRPGLDAVPME